jgi:hypothetical protein
LAGQNRDRTVEAATKGRTEILPAITTCIFNSERMHRAGLIASPMFPKKVWAVS